MPLIECVPNFSEGRDASRIASIAGAIQQVEGAYLLDVDIGPGANRTVMTFVGQPEPVLAAAFNAIRLAAELIDMRSQSGEHPRIGATDVCPLIPLEGATMEQCVELAHRLGVLVGERLKIPVYLYGEAAKKPERAPLPFLRIGQYEGLQARMLEPGFQPDCGPASFNEKSGATVIGARQFLIAYNINLATEEVKIARRIAGALRESGSLARDVLGRVIRDEQGNPIRSPGRLKACRAVGWYIQEFHCAQVSTNLINISVTSLKDVFDVVKTLALEMGTEVTGSELVGMVPLEALIDCGRKLTANSDWQKLSEFELVSHAVEYLGLSQVKAFRAEEKVLEYRMASLLVK